MVVTTVSQHGSPNCIAFGQYILLAGGNSAPKTWQIRGIAIAALSITCILHAVFPKTGTRLITLLGVFKIVVVLIIIFAGFAALGGHLKIPKPNNFSHPFENSSVDVYDYVIGLNFVNFSYAGWQIANYVYVLVVKTDPTGFGRGEDTRKDHG